MQPGTADRIKLCVRGLYDAQKLRIQLQLRIERLIREELMTEADAERFFKLPFSYFEKAEAEMQRLVWSEVKDLPIVRCWMTKVKGIGPRLSGLLVANIGDIGRFANVAKLWAYCGLHTVDGRAARRRKGERASWSQELKVTAWKIAQSFVKAGGPYRELYDRYKERIIERETNRGNDIYQMVNNKWALAYASRGRAVSQTASASHETREEPKSAASRSSGEAQAPSATPEWTLGRINSMALRYVAKMFLSHVWEVWRTLEGLPTREPYALEYLGHSTKLDPWDFAPGAERPKQATG